MSNVTTLYNGTAFNDVDLTMEDCDKLERLLMKDCEERLKSLYLLVYDKTQMDMTAKTREFYAVMEGIFHLSVPQSTPPEMRLRPDVAYSYVEDFVRSQVKTEDYYCALLAVCKYVRHKEISLIMSARKVDVKSFIESLSGLKKVMSAMQMRELQDGCDKIRDELYRGMTEHTNRLFKMVHATPYYPWAPLTYQSLMHLERETATPFVPGET